MSAIALETVVPAQPHLRLAPFAPITAPEVDATDSIERWELHSELAFVSVEVRARALELIPQRDPDALFTRARESAPAIGAAEPPPPRLSAALFGYVVWRVVETAGCALAAVVAVVALALLADVLHAVI